VQHYEPSLLKELTKKQKQNLEKLGAALLAPATRWIGIDVLIASLARAELRVAYLLSGDVLATVDELRGLDPAFLHATDSPGRRCIAAAVAHPFAGDVIRYALTTEATALRRRVGATWAGG
jgi:hypothetical protein